MALCTEVIFYKGKYHLTECLYRDRHEKESEDTYDEVCPDFAEFSEYSATEHDDESCDDARECYTDETIGDTIPMHRDDICHTWCGEREGECERDDESFIEVFMEDMISLDMVYLRRICLFTAYHRERYKK